LHTRPRVQRAPGLPCTLYLGWVNLHDSGTRAARSRMRV